MTQEIHPDTAGPIAAPRSLRTIGIWAGLVMAVLILIALGLASHKSGVPTVAPGQKAAPASRTALNNLTDRIQALSSAHPKAFTRQADAKG